MNPQRNSSERAKPSHTLKAKLLAIGLFTASIGGTFAIFGCVPLLARFVSPSSRTIPRQVQAFPEMRQPSTSPSEPAIPSPSKQARAIFSGDRHTPTPLRRRSAL